MPGKKSEFQKRLEAEEADMRTALASLTGRPGALTALRRECDRLVQYAETRYDTCKASADQAVSESRKAIGANEPLPQEVEKFFMAYYLLELERADQDLKIVRRLREMSNAP